MFDWLDDYQQGWTFEKLYPSPELANLDLKPAKASDENPENAFLRQKHRLPHKSAHNALYGSKPPVAVAVAVDPWILPVLSDCR
jgi:hypothetical protein